MKAKFRLLAMMLACAVITVACDEENPVNTVEVALEAKMPAAYSNISADSITLKVTNRYTGGVNSYITNAQGVVTTTLEEGVYTFEASATKYRDSLFADGTTRPISISLVGSAENISINNANTSVSLTLMGSALNPEGSWVIKEIFYSGSKTSADKQFIYNQFFEIYNNSSVTLYADGLSIGETHLNNLASNKDIYLTSINDTTYVRAMYTIPGSGTDYPVEPGKSVLIAPQPINHNTIIPPIDLSIADFQWYDYVAAAGASIDVPEVPNLIRHYSYSASIWSLRINNAGTFVLFKVENPDTHVANNTDMRPNNTAGKTTTSIRVSNKNMIDAVETRDDGFESKMISVALDAGYTYCTTTKEGKSIRRKVKEVKNGRTIYQDTNNSTNDFIPDATPQPKIFTAD